MMDKRSIVNFSLKLMFLLFASMGLSVSYAADQPDAQKSQTCPVLNAHKVAFLFDRWNDSLKSLDPQQVAANYAMDAVLLPTLSNTPRTSHEQIIDYFTSFLKSHPVGKIDQRVIRYGSDWASDTGLYTFRLTENGHVRYVEARYSFVYECIEGKWLIVHHHSSMMPS